MIISWNYCQFTPICRFLLRLEKVHLFSCFVLFERERTLYLLCMPIPLSLLENQQLYGTPFLLIWLLLFPFFKCYVWQFSQTLFYEICFVACTKIQLVTLWEIESRRPNLSAWKFRWTWIWKNPPKIYVWKLSFSKHSTKKCKIKKSIVPRVSLHSR